MRNFIPAATRTVIFDGVEYLAGTAGSLILSCPIGGDDRFRDGHDYFLRGSKGAGNEMCFCCEPSVRMEPVKIADLEAKWHPLWKAIDSRSTVGDEA